MLILIAPNRNATMSQYWGANSEIIYANLSVGTAYVVNTKKQCQGTIELQCYVGIIGGYHL